MDVQLVTARKKLYKSTRAKFLKLSTDNVHVFFPFFDQRNGNVLLSCWCPQALSIDVPGL